jgi:SHS2 domain-containing protein
VGTRDVVDAREFPIPGVRGLEHTADVGLEITAPTLPELFSRGAKGAMWLVLERWPEAGLEPSASRPRAVGGHETPKVPLQVRSLELTEDEPPVLFRAWLRTLLLWEEMDGFVFREAALMLFPTPGCGAPDGVAIHLQARVEGVVDHGPRVREIKGVTLHDLRMELKDGSWYGRVIFDV